MFSDGSNSRSWNQGIWDVSATKKEHLGALRITPDGRKFRYARCGPTTALVAGYMGVAADSVAHHIECSCATANIGDRNVLVTLGATAVTVNQYQDGYLIVNKGTGIGHQYHIESHSIGAASGTVEIILSDPIRVALVASGTSEVSLTYSPFANVAVSGDEENLPVGLSIRVVPVSNYYWAQTGGAAGWICTENPAIGGYIILDDATGGKGQKRVTALDVDTPALAINYGHTGVALEMAKVWLIMD